MKIISSTLQMTFFLLLLGIQAASCEEFYSVFDGQIKKSDIVISGIVTKNHLTTRSNGKVESNMTLSEVLVVSSSIDARIKLGNNLLLWNKAVEDINSGNIFVEIARFDFNDSAKAPLDIGKRYLFFLELGSSGVLKNIDPCIPAIPWSLEINKLLKKCKFIDTNNVNNGKLNIIIPQPDPFNPKKETSNNKK